MRDAGIDSTVRMKIIGHATDAMDRRYGIVDLANIQEAGKSLEEAG